MATARETRRPRGERKTAPGLRQLVPVPYGIGGRWRHDPMGFLSEGVATYGDVFRFRLGHMVFHMLAHPDHVRHVLVDNQKNYPRSWYYNRTKVVIGEGLVSTEGASWKRLRRMSQPAFHHGRVEALASMMTDAAAAMLGGWQAHAASGKPLDVAAEFVGLTLRIVGRALMSVDLESEAKRVGEAVTIALAFLEQRVNNLVSLPVFVPTPSNLRARRALRTLDALVYPNLARRRQSQEDCGDLLSMLLAVRDEETGAGLSDLELRDQIITFIGAGHETTAVALAWTVYLLSQNPAARARQAAEVALVLGGRAPTIADLPRLAFTRQVIEESLRLYPPVYAIVRDAVKDDQIGGFHIPARSTVILSPYITHHHPGIWPEPDTFNPDRFSPDQAALRSRFAWYPFLAGPHQCIGQEFAMMEMTLVIAMLAQAYRLELAPGTRVEAQPMFSLRPKGGLRMIVHHV